MDEIILEAIDNYYRILSKTGSFNNGQLIYLIYLNRFLKRYQGLITDFDYTVIDRAIKCIQDSSCIVPSYTYTASRKPINNFNNRFVRLIQPEDSIREREDFNISLVD